MKRSLIIFLFFFFVLIVDFDYLFAQNVELNEDDLEIDTSIVMLDIVAEEIVVKSDPFFEIINFYDKEYFLIPINLLTSYVQLDINFYRETHLLIVSNSHNNMSVKIDLNKRKYINHEDWSEEPPVVFGGDFFVCPDLLEYLLDIKVEWEPSYQRLTLKGDYFKKEEKYPKDKVKEIEKEKPTGEELKEKLIKGEDFSLSSVHYKFGAEYRKKSNNVCELVSKETINVFGRAGDWTFALGEEGNYDLRKRLI